jgi:hyperosmotically inducible periplasmic protein
VVKNVALLMLISLLSLTAACSGETETKTTETTPAPSAEPAATDADNTARNAEITAAEAPTAQGESEADIKTTAAIRKAVVDDKSLSVNAHNVKIVTANGVVSLRGPVKSEDERMNIEAKAKQAAGVTRVHNFLEVEKNP